MLLDRVAAREHLCQQVVENALCNFREEMHKQPKPDLQRAFVILHAIALFSNNSDQAWTRTLCLIRVPFHISSASFTSWQRSTTEIARSK
jgi:hypothetical protein